MRLASHLVFKSYLLCDKEPTTSQIVLWSRVQLRVSSAPFLQKIIRILKGNTSSKKGKIRLKKFFYVSLKIVSYLITSIRQQKRWMDEQRFFVWRPLSLFHLKPITCGGHREFVLPRSKNNMSTLLTKPFCFIFFSCKVKVQ